MLLNKTFPTKGRDQEYWPIYDLIRPHEVNNNVPSLNDPIKSNRYFWVKIRSRNDVNILNGNVYKYMDIESFFLCLQNHNLRFVEPTEWPDKYEKRFYEAKIKISGKECPIFDKKVYGCCFTLNKSSEAAWKTYSYGKVGLGAHCVQLVIDINALREEINMNTPKSYKIVEGRMFYKFDDKTINEFHKNHLEWCTPIDSLKKLGLLLIKRQQFYYEKEMRFMIVSPRKQKKSAFFVRINWGRVIKNIYVDKKISDVEFEILKKHCNTHGVRISSAKQTGIHLERKDIYQMNNDEPVVFC